MLGVQPECKLLQFKRYIAGILLTCALAANDSVFAQSAPEAEKQNPQATIQDLVWPPPPLDPRIRYLRSISNPDDIGRKKGFWRRAWEFIRGPEAELSMIKPMSVAVDPLGRLFVADPSAVRVHVFDEKEADYQSIALIGDTPLKHPISVTVDDAGNIYIADSLLASVFMLSPEFELVKVFGEDGALQRPTGMAVDSAQGFLYVVDTPEHQIKVFDIKKGIWDNAIGQRGTGKGEFNYPTFVATDSRGRIYITDSLNHRIQIFDRQGFYVASFGKVGDAPGDIRAPKDIALDSDGHIYVADAVFDNIQIFDDSGQLLLFWGGTGQDEGRFWLPTGVFIAGDDKIYVADSYNSRVQVFQYLSKE